MLVVGARLHCLWPLCCWFRSCLGIEHTCLKVTPSLSSWNNVWGGYVYQADSTAEEAASHPSPVLHVSSVIQAALHVLSINDVMRQNPVNAIFNLLFVDLLNIHAVSVSLLTLLLIVRALFLASSMGWQDDGIHFLVTEPWIAHYIS